MKVCTFCGLKTDDKSSTCASCGSSDFLNVCPNCSNEFEGKFCPDCGTKYNQQPTICSQCRTKYFTKACPNCGYISGGSIPNINYGAGTRTGNVKFSEMNANERLAFICGILGIFFLPIPLSIISLVYAGKEKKAGNDSSAVKISMVLGILGLMMGIMYLMFMIISCVAAVAGNAH